MQAPDIAAQFLPAEDEGIYMRRAIAQAAAAQSESVNALKGKLREMIFADKDTSQVAGLVALSTAMVHVIETAPDPRALAKVVGEILRDSIDEILARRGE